jgi:hypothetical protein
MLAWSRALEIIRVQSKEYIKDLFLFKNTR